MENTITKSENGTQKTTTDGITIFFQNGEKLPFAQVKKEIADILISFEIIDWGYGSEIARVAVKDEEDERGYYIEWMTLAMFEDEHPDDDFDNFPRLVPSEIF